MVEQPQDLITDETVSTFLAGPPAEMADFAFLLGEWEHEAIRYDAQGSVQRTHRGRWRARTIASGRIVLDEVISLRADGTEIASMATLRTFCPTPSRWEMTFLTAHQPALPISFGGARVGDELHLEVRVAGAPEAPCLAKVRFFDIQPDRFRWEQSMRSGEDAYEKSVEISASRTSEVWRLPG
ncbi:MAG: hypothetical protein AAF430_25180 [Myxococcota bacterium]